MGTGARFGALQAGRPVPLGATYDGEGVNFAVFSAHAERMQLCLFDSAGRREVARLDLPECTDEIWHGYLPGARRGQLYGYRAHGAYAPMQGQRFNPNKLLIDPYARQLHGSLRHSASLHGYRVGSGRADLSFDRRDSASSVPKSVVFDDPFRWAGVDRPRVPWESSVIYETHVRGFSKAADGIALEKRGTFAALADPRLIEHLVRLGVTAIELLPVQAFIDDEYLHQRGLRNYWGYSTLSYFAPHARYLATGDPHEIRRAVMALHEAGIEVILDVVYNHTCEGNQLGPTLCFRGLDNLSYYRAAEDPRYLINDSGCGNTVNTAHPRVLQLITDSLRHWAEQFGIDGFRFDLGVALGREPHGFDPDGRVFSAIRQDPLLGSLKLISEPWDLGPGGYQLGNHPPGFAEWNGRFRDDVRAFWRGDPGTRGALASSIEASADLFDRRHRRPWSTVNFVTAHDGFTLRDLVSYNEKHNEANAENNADGADDNYSNNHGVEGPTDDADIEQTRGRVVRAMLGTLLLSQGTPMLLGGDEFGRSQQGNNNAYCQDNPMSWLDWSLLESDEGRRLRDFVARLTELRRRHAAVAGNRFLHGEDEPAPGFPDICWYDESGDPMTEEAWNDPAAHLLAVRRVARGPDGTEACLLLVNGGVEAREFVLPAPALEWRLELDSAEPEREPASATEGPLSVPAHSLMLLTAMVPAGEGR